MTNQLAVPQCFVEIFPFEGGPFFIEGNAAQLLSATVTRSLKGDRGEFELVLAPGGPNGIAGQPTWTEVLTPQSLVLIGMRRWKYSQVVMVGVLRTISESQVWDSEKAYRTIVVRGEDFGYFFNSFNWYALTFLGTQAATAIGQQLGVPEAGLPAILAGNVLQGTPDQVAATWYNQIMAGAKGILSQTMFQYRGQSISFTQAVATLFQPYPGFQIPFGDFFIAAEGTWTKKFRDILPFPWYEFFVLTAPTGFYPGASGGNPFAMRGLGPSVTASPVLVGRVSPHPRIQTSTSAGNVSFGAVDITAWNALPLFTPDASFISSNITFDTDEVRNFYILNPVWFRRMFGESNSTLIPFIFSFVGAADVASIHRYGFHPEYSETRWLADITGGVAQGSSGLDLQALIATLTSQVFSYYEPTPLMGRAGMETVLRPDIMPGCRFRYAPFKNEAPWDFYIETVTHKFEFGGRSTTSVALSRGLPTAVYNDSSQAGILTQAHLGNAMRQNGVYKAGLPAGSSAGLQPFSMGDVSIMNVLGNIAKVYVSPQAP